MNAQHIFIFHSAIFPPMELSILDEVESDDSLYSLEGFGDFLATPGRLFFGRSYTLERSPSGEELLKNHERFPSMQRTLFKTAIAILLPLSLLSTLAGLGLKLLARKLDPSLWERASLPSLIHAREEENFLGTLPPTSLFPNCVSSQQKSLWGELYNTEPIEVPAGMKDPLKDLKALLSTAQRPFLKSENLVLVEERENYLHYTYTVVIPSGALKGTYIDDLDIYYNTEKNCFEIRSASRTGFRDATHLDFSKPGANKNRIEALRGALQDL